MPPAIVEEICTITGKGQTTVPKAIRQALGVGYGGRIAFRVDRGRVTVHALSEMEGAEDPALTPFLALLEADLAGRPAEVIRPFPEDMSARLGALTAKVGPFELDDVVEGTVSL